jgi:tRNA threonylcarbamoyladenosine biosynthesis protein TsaB
MPTILAIETSSELASVALLRGDSVLSRQSTGVRTHSASVLPMAQELLAEAGIGLGDCDAIAFGSGPGSFTGVRTACGVAQGLAFGAGLPVIPLVTLPAMAQACHEQVGATEVLCVLDARMNEVYAAQYRLQDGAWLEVSAPALCAPGDVQPVDLDGLVACGNGFSAYPDAFHGKPFAAAAMAEVLPHAAQLARLAARELEAGRTLGPADAQPLYLRNKIAYTAAERQVINAAKAAA